MSLNQLHCKLGFGLHLLESKICVEAEGVPRWYLGWSRLRQVEMEQTGHEEGVTGAR